MADLTTQVKAADIYLASALEQEAQQLLNMFNIMEIIPAQPGETLKQAKITGSLTTTEYVEGQEIPVTTYTTEDVATYEVELKPYRVAVPLQQIQKRGYDAAVSDSDRKLIGDIKAAVKEDIVTVLSNAGATATGAGLVECAANSWAVLQNAAEECNVGDITPVFLCNPVDFAASIGKSEVFAAFGLQYIQNFAGLGNLIATNAIPAGTLYCTCSQNMQALSADANNVPGFDFETDDSGIIAVKHVAEITKLTYETVAYTALKFFARYTNLIVKGTVAAKA